MEIISEQDIINKGLDYIKTLNEFKVHGNHYIPYPKVLSKLGYKIETEYFGPSDQGTAVSIFRKPNFDDNRKEIELEIKKLSRKYDISIVWRYINEN